MALTADYTQIKDYENVCWTKEEGQKQATLNVVTQTLVFYTMSIQMGEITEKNHEEFFARVFMLESIDGTSIIVGTDNGIEQVRITLEDVMRHIGLKTNVSTVAKKSWVRWFFNDRLDSKIHQIQRAKAAAS